MKRLLLLLLCLFQFAGADELELKLTKRGVEIKCPLPAPLTLWRGYQPVDMAAPGNSAEFRLTKPNFVDEKVPSGVWLHYLAVSAQGYEAEGKIWIPKRPLPTLLYPRIQVDKLNYTLAVLDEEKVVKRYPISLGGDPRNRKFCLDRLSTPEGVYDIIGVQPQATFYRAYDIDYPNDIDELRHQLSIQAGLVGKSRSIGGEIQIHGDGIEGNWTHGCMGMRNSDMDELFSSPRLGKRTEVFITGSQIAEEDRIWLLIPPESYVLQVQEILNKEGFSVGQPDGDMNEQTSLALGRLQRVSGLEISCQLDHHTRKFLAEHYDLRTW